MLEIGIILILVVIAIIIFTNIRIVPQANVYVIERLGTFYQVWESGVHVKIPFFDRIAEKISIKERVVEFQPQRVITRDNVTIQIDSVIFFQVTDAKQFAYGVENPMSAIESLTSTTLRNIIGDLELDSTLTSRDVINTEITAILDTSTDKWGIKVNRVELQNILPPPEIQDAMEKQMKAERERRESILRAEGEKRSQILIAEGERESQVLRARANKEARVLMAEGEAEAIRTINEAEAANIRALNEASPTREVLALRSFEAFEKVADGKSTKIIIPSELQSMAGFATSLKEFLSDDTKQAN